MLVGVLSAEDIWAARRIRRERLRALIALPLSLGGHAVVVGLVLAIAALTARPKPERVKSHPVSIRSIGNVDWEHNRGAVKSESGPSSPVRERPTPHGQVVDVAPGNDLETPEAKYLAETSNRVKKETRAREQTPVYSHATPTTSSAPLAMPTAKGSTAGRAAPPKAAVSALELLAGTQGFRPRLTELLHEATPGRAESNLDSPEVAGVEGGEGQTIHSGDVAAVGGGAPNDALSDVEAGDGTFLNTREWKFAGFFNRVKQAVSARWDPDGRLRSRDPSGRATAWTNRLTVLNVALRADGSLREVFVAQTSGLDYLDQEAIAAFEKAAPFANPPAGLVQDGLIQFRFGFTVTNEGMTVPKMFRGPRY